MKVVAKSKVRSDKIDEFKDKAEELIEKTRNEEGNISYELCQEVENPNILTFIEEWESQEALKMHMQTEHFKNIFPELKKLLVEEMEEPEIDVYKLENLST